MHIDLGNESQWRVSPWVMFQQGLPFFGSNFCCGHSPLSHVGQCAVVPRNSPTRLGCINIYDIASFMFRLTSSAVLHSWRGTLPTPPLSKREADHPESRSKRDPCAFLLALFVCKSASCDGFCMCILSLLDDAHRPTFCLKFLCVHFTLTLCASLLFDQQYDLCL